MSTTDSRPSSQEPSSHQPAPAQSAAHPSIDPVCGMQVDPATSRHRLRHQGIEHVFCSAGCQRRFAEAPQRYLEAVRAESSQPVVAATAPETVATRYTCLMHPEVCQDQAGNCPRCGMALEPQTPLAPASRSEYTCPMHPEIVREAPGECPICGMALESRAPTAAEEENPELEDMHRRFVFAGVLTAPLVFLAMGDMLPG